MAKELVHDLFKIVGLSVKKYQKNDEEKREQYLKYNRLYRKYKEFTMIPEYAYIDNLTLADKFKNVPGSVVECGVWRGGMVSAIAELIGNGKNYFLFDSFEGLPPAVNDKDGKDAVDWQSNKNSEHYYDNCKAEMQFAQQAMKLAGIDNPKIIQGWFNETLHKNDPGKIAILRLDGDWYESTMTCLKEFYPKVSDGGLILIDDYNFWEGCSKAVHDYLSANQSSDRIHQSEHGVAYIIKNEKIKRSW